MKQNSFTVHYSPLNMMQEALRSGMYS